jgi:AraC-like DNA-binding protein
MAVYSEHPPHPALAHHVEAVWSLRAGAARESHRVLPDGCIDIVVPADGPAFVAGPMRRPLLHTMAPGERVGGLRLRPGAAPALLGVAADELLDLFVPLDALWRDAGGDVEAAARRRVGRREPDGLVLAAVARLERDPGTEIRALAAGLALSERQLRRRFHEAVGYGPKRLGRVLRLQRLLGEARQVRTASVAELAAAAGYADQPHMAREVRELAATTPARLLAERGRSVQDGAAPLGETR